MTSNYIIVPIKLCLDVGNDKYILLCTFGSRIMSSSEGKQGDLQSNPPSPNIKVARKAKKAQSEKGEGYFFWPNKESCCYLILLIFSLILLVKILQKPHCVVKRVSQSGQI